ncbi:MAG TPA: acyltransferase [Flavobacterium sp.]|jgi:peptidoglycan/LPS O-acetylase OafA/YrhL
MTERRHFATFDALRFLAFFCVFISHLAAPADSWFSYLQKSGGLGVRFFFVLSGFLITYILLFEKQHKARINLKNFFMRRTLRIWPLFYAMILFAFLTPVILRWTKLPFSSEGYEPNWILSCLFLENYQMMATGSFPDSSPLNVMWSLCVEEHFYIFWGLLIFVVSVKQVPKLIAASIIGATVVRVLYSNLGLPFLDMPSNIDYFAFGAIPAYCLLYKPRTIEKLQHLPHLFKYLVAASAIFFVFASPHFAFALKHFVDPILSGLLFMLAVSFTLPGMNKLHVSDHHIMSRLGVFTYGLYLFHTICINLLLQLARKIGFQLQSSFDYLIFGVIAFLLTVVASVLSYYLFELKFLKLKKRFQPVEVSGFGKQDTKTATSLAQP